MSRRLLLLLVVVVRKDQQAVEVPLLRGVEVLPEGVEVPRWSLLLRGGELGCRDL